MCRLALALVEQRSVTPQMHSVQPDEQVLRTLIVCEAVLLLLIFIIGAVGLVAWLVPALAPLMPSG